MDTTPTAVSAANNRGSWAKVLLTFLGIAELNTYLVIFTFIVIFFTFWGVFASGAGTNVKQFNNTVFLISFPLSLPPLLVLIWIFRKGIGRYKRGNYSVTWRWIVIYIFFGLSFFFTADSINEILGYLSYF